jgi:hypothetical protein
MKRRLRIAVSVFFAVAAVLLCVLWVRSYWWRDRIVIPLTAARTLRVDSDHGKFQFETYGKGMGEWYLSLTAIAHTEISAAWKSFTSSPEPQDRQQWRWEETHTGRFFVYVPHWFLVLLTASIAIITAAAPWIGRHFSRRTMLIAVTLLAVLLGLRIWLTS